jgi:hypothetical protein
VGRVSKSAAATATFWPALAKVGRGGDSTSPSSGFGEVDGGGSFYPQCDLVLM